MLLDGCGEGLRCDVVEARSAEVDHAERGQRREVRDEVTRGHRVEPFTSEVEAGVGSVGVSSQAARDERRERFERRHGARVCRIPPPRRNGYAAFEMETFVLRPGLRVGVLGHSQAGKSALITALTRHVSTRSYGARTRPAPPISNEATRSTLRRSSKLRHDARLVESGAREYTVVDVPGRRRYLRHVGMLTACVDACVLVVSAIEGVMPQTRAHCILAKQHTPGAIVAFINRCDEVTDLDQLDFAEMETREALLDAGFDGDAVTIVRGAAAPPEAQLATWSPALDDVLDAFDRGFSDVQRRVEAPLVATVMHRWNRVDRSGPVVEMSLQQGRLREGARVAVLDRYGVVRKATAASLRHNEGLVKALDAGMIGTALLVFEQGQPWTSQRFPRLGDTLFERAPALTRSVTARVSLIATARGGRAHPAPHGHEVQVWLAGREVRCRLLLPGGAGRIQPGETCDGVTLELGALTYVTPGTTFAMRDGSDGESRRDLAGAALRGGCVATGQVLAVTPSESR